MHSAKGNGLTAGNSQPAETHAKNTTNSIAILQADQVRIDAPRLLAVSDVSGADADQGAPDRKAIATQIARLALAGHAVHKGQHGDYTVCKYGMTRYCQDAAELAAFAKLLGVKIS